MCMGKWRYNSAHSNPDSRWNWMVYSTLVPLYLQCPLDKNSSPNWKTDIRSPKSRILFQFLRLFQTAGPRPSSYVMLCNMFVCFRWGIAMSTVDDQTMPAVRECLVCIRSCTPYPDAVSSASILMRGHAAVTRDPLTRTLSLHASFLGVTVYWIVMVQTNM
jgi:hypothetical protein